MAMGGGGTGDDEGRLHGRVWECGERRWRAVGGVCVVEWGGEGKEVVWDGRAPADWWEAQEDQRAIEALPLADLQKIAEGLEDDAQAEDVKNTAAESEAAASQATPAQPAAGLESVEEEADAGGKRQSDSE